MNTRSKALVIISGAALMLGAGNAAFGKSERDKGPKGPRAMLQAMDTNQDRKISLEEFTGGERMMITQFDANSDGIISPEEIDAAVTARAERMRSRFLEEIDANKDGSISTEEITSSREQRFAMLDANSDGFIDRSDMRERMRKRRDERGGWFGWGRGGDRGGNDDSN